MNALQLIKIYLNFAAPNWKLENTLTLKRIPCGLGARGLGHRDSDAVVVESGLDRKALALGSKTFS